MKTEVYNAGVSFRISAMGYRALCHAIRSVPGVVGLTRHRTSFWSSEGICAEFSFRNHDFIIEIDQWDGALWVMTKNGQCLPEEMQILRDAVDQTGAELGFLGRLWQRFVAGSFI